jgi:hypothetical protein
MKHRVLNDGKCGITLTLGVGPQEAEARVSWCEGSCMLDAASLVLGLWVQLSGEVPPAIVVCRATALAVGAWIKEDVARVLERLP